MNAVSPHVCPAVCPTGTTGVSHAGACWVQNQNQNQRSVVTAVCGVSGSNSIHLTVTYGRRSDLTALPCPAMDGRFAEIGGGWS